MAGVAYSKHMSLPKNLNKGKKTTSTVVKKDSIAQEAEPVVSGIQNAEAAPDETASPDLFSDALNKAYNDDLDKEIRKGLALVYERFVRLQSQERPPDWEVAKDDLGNSSTWYENLFWSIKDGVEPGNKETVYMKLATLPFTSMKNLEAIKQQYQINM